MAEPATHTEHGTFPLFDQGVLDQLLTHGGAVPMNQADNPYLKRLRAFGRSLLNTPTHSLISLFCGGGGVDLGLGFAGFHTLVANDVAPAFVETVVRNMPSTQPCVADALKLTGKQLLHSAGTDSVDLVAAGPPCQSFSILGQRGALDDPRGKLALKYFDLVAEIAPRAFIFENVPGILSVNEGQDWRVLLDYAARITGFHLYWSLLNAVSFGIPQVRERVILVGFRDDVPFDFPTTPTGPGARALVAEGRLATPSIWALAELQGTPNHNVRKHGDRVRGRYTKLRPGARDRIDHTDRIEPSRPSGTVLVGSADGGGRPHVHPFEPRVITVREAARLQSFPDWYVFWGTGTSQYRQIGNAVPPLLMYEVGKKIAESLAETAQR